MTTIGSHKTIFPFVLGVVSASFGIIIAVAWNGAFTKMISENPRWKKNGLFLYAGILTIVILFLTALIAVIIWCYNTFLPEASTCVTVCS